ncbi:hypothetical protein [Entomospira culicis]|uniref:DUF4878 domain-containing protein n=1 Tax=Entomospira culicis TaxID=2719989 RepID=A0A968GDM1_9SPIO|nr:hypothetical protein [Entomospira culicis]NIZ18418.1 hypothetical protein [Entomospira culicis]NIZ68634.1 hypothetical protein [Entomospira culicis]WDI37234.1 hypothetical protein PVA46_00140 [Entomospira culicis]WDI38862.1 hypothetical protein PVA47_00150 [Entomospira culicis]
MRKFYLLWMWALVLPLSCRGVLGISDSPEGVANDFVRHLYQLNFDPLSHLAQGSALEQVALLEGHADAFSLTERQRYANSSVLVTEFSLNDQESEARAKYTLTFQDGQTLENQITLQLIDKRWQVVAFATPLIEPHIYIYFED